MIFELLSSLAFLPPPASRIFDFFCSPTAASARDLTDLTLPAAGPPLAKLASAEIFSCLSLLEPTTSPL